MDKLESLIITTLRERPLKFSELWALVEGQTSLATFKRHLRKLCESGCITKQSDGRYRLVDREPKPEPSKPAANLNVSQSPVWLIDIAEAQRAQPPFTLQDAFVTFRRFPS